MHNDFSQWIEANNLSEVVTTQAGDSLYVNREKKYLVIKKAGSYNTQAFYLDDIIEFNTYDDEKLICNWIRDITGSTNQRSTSFSTNEDYMKIRLKNQTILRFQIFKAVNGNIERNSQSHVNLFSYACKISQAIYDLTTKL